MNTPCAFSGKETLTVDWRVSLAWYGINVVLMQSIFLIGIKITHFYITLQPLYFCLLKVTTQRHCAVVSIGASGSPGNFNSLPNPSIKTPSIVVA